MNWLAFRFACMLHKMKKVVQNVNSPDSKLKRAREAVTELKLGKERPDLYIEDINEALEVGWSYKDIGTTRDELIKFRNGESQKILAKKVLERGRLYSNLTHDQVSRLAKKAGFSLEEIGTNEAELKSIDRKCMRKIYSSYVERLRTIQCWDHWNDDPEILYSHTLHALSDEYNSEYQFIYEDFGTSQEELPNLLKAAYFRRAKNFLIGIKKRSLEGHGIEYDVKYLRELLQKAEATLDNLGSSEDELQNIIKISNIEGARVNLNELRLPKKNWISLPSEGCPGDADLLTNLVREKLALANATLTDIGSSEEEMTNLLNSAYIYSANQLVNNLRSISKTPRMKKGEKLMAMLGPKQIILPSAESEKFLNELEDAYPVERDVVAINLYLKKAGATLDSIGSSEQELKHLAEVVLAR